MILHIISMWCLIDYETNNKYTIFTIVKITSFRKDFIQKGFSIENVNS